MINVVNIGNDWDALLKDEFEKDYYIKLRKNLVQEYNAGEIYPNAQNIFNALKYTPYNDVKVVILGQDPYHGAGQAHGLAFSVQEGVILPPSLVNVFKEIKADIGCEIPKSGCLTRWAEQGVLLLNATLTVRAGQANSHQKIGWSIFTDRIITLLNEREKPIVFLLWGGSARKKAELVTNKQHKILQAVHPSPLSAFNGFFGCKHFSKANEYLLQMGEEPINWDLN